MSRPRRKSTLLQRRNLVVLLVLAFVVILFSVLWQNKILADAVTQPSLKGAKIEVNVDNPHSGGIPSEFPNNRDCINFTVSAYNSSGSYLANQPLNFTMSSSFVLRNDQGVELEESAINSGPGQSRFCLTALRSTSGSVTVRFNNYPRTKKSFKVSFRPNGKIKDATDKNDFIYDQPITFSAEIAPWMVDNLVTKRVVYTYKRHYKNFWGKSKYRQQSEVVNLSCVDGQCLGTLSSDRDGPTDDSAVSGGKFKYRFEFVDENGKRFSKTFSGTFKKQ